MCYHTVRANWTTQDNTMHVTACMSANDQAIQYSTQHDACWRQTNLPLPMPSASGIGPISADGLKPLSTGFSSC
jgi:hypothetical protein